MKTLLKILIGITLALNVTFMFSQHFRQAVPDDFRYVGLQIDGGGSLDKQGLNSIISFGAEVGKTFEIELQIQTIFNGALDYADLQLGIGYIFWIKRLSITPGIHVGQMYRPKKYIDPSYKGFAGGFIGGLTFKGRYFITNKIAIVGSASYDYRWDLVRYGDYFRLNCRAGVEYLIN